MTRTLAHLRALGVGSIPKARELVQKFRDEHAAGHLRWVAEGRSSANAPPVPTHKAAERIQSHVQTPRASHQPSEAETAAMLCMMPGFALGGSAGQRNEKRSILEVAASETSPWREDARRRRVDQPLPHSQNAGAVGGCPPTLKDEQERTENATLEIVRAAAKAAFVSFQHPQQPTAAVQSYSKSWAL